MKEELSKSHIQNEELRNNNMSFGMTNIKREYNSNDLSDIRNM